MADESIDIQIRVIGARQAAAELDRVGDGLDKVDRNQRGVTGSSKKANTATASLTRTMKYAAGAAATYFGAMEGFRFLASSVSAASDLQEAVGKNAVVFGKASKGMREFATNLDAAYGITQKEALDTSALFGVMFKNMADQGPKSSAKMSKALVKLAGDLSSFHNVAGDEVLEKLAAGLRGETEPLSALGVDLRDATIKEYAYAEGIAKRGEELTQQQKVMARYGSILQQTSDAQGDAIRTQDTLAGQQRIMRREVDELRLMIGKGLVPVVTRLAKGFNGLIRGFREGHGAGGDLRSILEAVWDVLAPVGEWFKRNPEVAKKLAIGLGLITGAFVVMVPVIWAVTVAMNALPIIAIMTAVIALAAGLVYAYKRWGWFRAAVNFVWMVLREGFSWLKDNWRLIVSIIGGPIVAAIVYFDEIKGAAGAAFDFLKRKFSDLRSWFSNLPSRFASAAKSIGTTVVNAIADGIRAAPGVISDAILDALPGPVRDALSKGGGLLGKLPGLATGGMSSGRRYIVGEHGPEVLDLPAGAQVTPNSQVEPMLRDEARGREHPLRTTIMLDGRVLAEVVGRAVADQAART